MTFFLIFISIKVMAKPEKKSFKKFFIICLSVYFSSVLEQLWRNFIFSKEILGSIKKFHDSYSD